MAKAKKPALKKARRRPVTRARAAQSPAPTSTTVMIVPELAQIPAVEILKRAHTLDLWAYLRAVDEPGLVEVVQKTRQFLRTFLMARFVWAALQHSPRRAFSGKQSAVEFLNDRVPRSTLFSFLNNDLGLIDGPSMDQFRCCKTMEEVIELCQPLKELACDILDLYEQHEASIEVSNGEGTLNDFHSSSATSATSREPRPILEEEVAAV